MGSKVTLYSVSAVSIMITESHTRQARGLTNIGKVTNEIDPHKIR